jgi:hypothetical protein
MKALVAALVLAAAGGEDPTYSATVRLDDV